MIDKVGANVTGLKVGDHVTAVGTWGCFAEYIVTEPMNVLRFPPEIPLIEGSLVEVLPGIIMALTRTTIGPGDDILVLERAYSIRSVYPQCRKQLVAS